MNVKPQPPLSLKAEVLPGSNTCNLEAEVLPKSIVWKCAPGALSF